MHYSGDSGATASYRKGTLYFYHNTVVSTRTDRTTLFRLSTNEERADARNNIFYVTAAGNTVSLLDSTGILDFSHNWLKPGWVNTFGTLAGVVNNDGTSVEGASPGFVNEAGQDYRLASGSASVNAGTTLNANVLPAHNVVRHYVKHQQSEARPADGSLDIGAYEFGSPTPADLVMTTTSLSGAQSESPTPRLSARPAAFSPTRGLLFRELCLRTDPQSTNLRVSGTPTAAGASPSPAVADPQSPADTDAQIFSITVNAAPVTPLNITTTSLPNARRNSSYNRTLQATGGVTPYTWSVVSGNLPPGLSLNASTGVVSGRATTTGTWNFTVRVADGHRPGRRRAALSITVVRKTSPWRQ